jgi:hypothetical protein
MEGKFRIITHVRVHLYEPPETQFEEQMNYKDQSLIYYNGVQLLV